MKKIIVIILILLGSLMTFNAIYADYQPTPGDIIKVNDKTKPALYYINSQGQRQLYSNAVTFWTWYSGDWNNIKDSNGNKVVIKYISQTDFDKLASGNNIIVRAGKKLIKFDNSYNVYAVSDNGVINKVASDGDSTVAVKLYGDNFKNNIVTIQSGFQSNYTEGQPLTVDSVVVPPAAGGWVSSSAGLTLDCGNNAHADQGGLGCSANSRPCSGTHGGGTQYWTNYAWGTCQLTSCDSLYILSNGQCLPSASVGCATSMHMENSVCVSNTRSCSVSNGSGGQQVWSLSTNSWADCYASQCNSGYIKLQNGQCQLQSINQTIGKISDVLVSRYGDTSVFLQWNCDVSDPGEYAVADTNSPTLIVPWTSSGIKSQKANGVSYWSNYVIINNLQKSAPYRFYVRAKNSGDTVMSAYGMPYMIPTP